MNLQLLGCWNHLEKLAEMFLNTFHRENILLKLKIKSYCEKLGLKTYQLEFSSCNSSSCTTNELSIRLASCLTAIKTIL